MKKQLPLLRTLFFLAVLVFGLAVPTTAVYGQANNQMNLSPNGMLDNVFDRYGNHYKLQDLLINNTANSTTGKIDDVTCTAGIFVLHYTAGCGMMPTDVNSAARRAVLCQVFSDLSNFIKTPLTTGAATPKVHIWVRDIAGLIAPTSPTTSGVLGMASGFNVVPAAPTAVTGGITDNEIWKTIHTGLDSYTGVVSPLIMSSGAGSSGTFYHGMVAINFSNTSYVNSDGTLGVNWNLNTGIACPANQFDLYTVVLHEVTHALGFASLMDQLGASRFGTGYNYYNRYDQKLKTATNTPLLSFTNSCNNPMYDNTFLTGGATYLHPGCTATDGLNSSGLPLDHTDCVAPSTNYIKYVGNSNTVPVYTPQCFEVGSSLSHFEDECYTNSFGFPNGNNAYFVMSNANGAAVTKRFLKPEERNTLCDVGYSLNPTYGSATVLNSSYTYGSTACEGLRVAGVNDGIQTGGAYAYIGTGAISIPVTGINGILTNDVAYSTDYITNNLSTLGFECLQDLYDTTARFNGTLTTLTGTASTTISFTSSVTGLHLLRYVPIANGVRGNITYVYVYVDNSNCSPSACSIVSNGSFETYSGCGVIESYVISNNATVNCWKNLAGTVDLYTPTCQNYLYTPQIGANYLGMVSYGSSGNNGLFAASEAIQQKLSVNLIGGETYTISLWCRKKLPSFLAYIDVTSFMGATLASLPLIDTNFSTTFPSISSFYILPSSLLASDTDWHLYTHTFTIPVGSNFNNIAIYSTPPAGSPFTDNYIFLDDIKITHLDSNTTFTLPQTCTSTTIDLSAYLTPAPTGGTFSWSADGGVTVTPITGTTFLTPSTAVTYTIYYNYLNNVGCPVTISSPLVVVTCLPCGITLTSATTTTNQSVCIYTPISSITYTTTGNPTSVSATGLPAGVSGGYNATTGVFTISGTPTASGTFSYTVTTTGTSCSTTTMTGSIIVNALPIAGTLSGNQSVCVNGVTSFSSTVTGGVWSSDTPTVANINSSGFIMAMAVGNATITYTVTGANSCQAMATRSITILNKPVIGSTSADNLCADSTGGSILLIVGVSSASTVTYQWYAQYTGSGTVTTLANGTSSTYLINTPISGEYWVVVTNSSGCSTISRRIKIIFKPTPTFATFPKVCYGVTPVPFTLPPNSSNGITGTWNPATISNTVTQNYTFTPTAGQCATSVTKSIIVETPFVANNDIISTPFSSTAQTLGNIKINDYQGTATSQIYLTSNPNAYTITFPNGIPAGITYNSNGSFNIPANLAIGNYSFVYKLASATGACPNNSSQATVNINILSNAITGRTSFRFCYSNNLIQSSQSIYNSTNLFNPITGANSTNSYIDYTTGCSALPKPSYININSTTGAFTIAAGTLPTSVTFCYRICTLGTGASNGLIYCYVDILSPLQGQDDTLTYNTNGVLVAINGVATTASSYNVLSNDHIFDCVNNTNSTATTSNVVFTVLSPGSAFVVYSSGVVYLQAFLPLPLSTYVYNYSIKALINTTIVEQHSVTINIVATSTFAPTATPTATNSKTTNLTTTNSQACPTCIDFPDANLKTILLTQGRCSDYPLNTTDIVDTNGDHEIEYDEAAHIGMINIAQANVTNLSGLEWFTNLKFLSIAANPITTVDTAMLSNGLTALTFNNTAIASLNFSNLPNLTQVASMNTPIGSLDFGANTALTKLLTKNCPNLTSINIKNTTSLGYTDTSGGGVPMSSDCWVNCPNLTSICADAFEIPALQSFLSTCGVSAASIDINSSCGLAVENHSIKEGITITPNPSSGVFVVAFANGISDKTELVVYNVLGQKMLAATVSSGSGQWQLDLSGYPSGAYLVKITSGSGVVEKTIIKAP